MQYTEEIAVRCASIGASLLDQYDPNWFHHIDLGDLTMSSACNCIIGQLYTDMVSDYSESLSDKFGEQKWITLVSQLTSANADLYQALEGGHQYPDIFLGFDVPFGDEVDYDSSGSERYEWLEAAWASEIKRRITEWATM